MRQLVDPAMTIMKILNKRRSEVVDRSCDDDYDNFQYFR